MDKNNTEAFNRLLPDAHAPLWLDDVQDDGPDSQEDWAAGQE